MQNRKDVARDRTGRVVTTVAVVAVAVVGVATALFAQRAERAPTQAGPPMALPAQPVPADRAVVQAPPLRDSMGAGAACATCGTVEMVVALKDRGTGKPSSYQMHIRMDDGQVRTVEQRGALAAGSRVMVDGNRVRALPAQAR